MNKPLPDQAYLLECFAYNPDTGILVWRERPAEHFRSQSFCAYWNRRYANNRAGAVMVNGYIGINMFGVPRYAHRIIWKMVTGADAAHEIDHKNRDRTDNRWANLREATAQDNQRNKSVSSNNSSGLKGVHYVKRRRKFCASICLNYKTIKLGRFDTAEEAHQAYIAAAKANFGEFWSS